MSACKIHPYYTKQFSINSRITGELNNNAFLYQSGWPHKIQYHPIRPSILKTLDTEGDSLALDTPNPINLN